ncbi:MAG: hypothetical protein PUE13_08960 [Clostridiales bacterium]|nr:hypothetical protein [Clostridiales bacterium]
MRKDKKRLILRICIITVCFMVMYAQQVFAIGTMWDLAEKIIKDVYNKIAGISTILAALMTTVCVVGMKLSNNQQKVDQSVDWLKRIWIAWAVINGIGGFLAYIQPLFADYNTIEVNSVLLR